jgi:phosphate starvation-inducible PhoH-like protein
MQLGRSVCALGMLLLKPAMVRSFPASQRHAPAFRGFVVGGNTYTKRVTMASKALMMRQKKEDFFDGGMEGYGGCAWAKGVGEGGKGHKKPLYLPKSENQQKYVDALNRRSISLIFSVGPAGTGKTLFACMYAIQELKKKNIDKIVLTRPVVTVDEDIGFLPGDINNKMDPWTRPIFDIFLEVFPQRELDMMVQNGVIEICPLAFMRGRTFKRAFILSDEMQNSSPNQMMMIATRIGEGSKMVITGDLNQSDRAGENGLKHFLGKIGDFERRGGDLDGLAVCFLENRDVERSPIVAKVLSIWTGQSCSQGAPHCDLEVEMSSQDLCVKLPPLDTNEIKDHEELKGLLCEASEEETEWCDKPTKKTTETPRPPPVPPLACSTEELELAAVACSTEDAALIPIQHMSKNRDLFR